MGYFYIEMFKLLFMLNGEEELKWPREIEREGDCKEELWLTVLH